MMKSLLLPLTAAFTLAVAAPVIQAQEALKIGYVNSDRVLRDASAAKAAEAKLEAEFGKRGRELNDAANQLKAAATKLDKDAPTLSEAERVRRQFAGTDHTRANMLDALGEVALRLELFDDADLLIREALAIRRTAFGARSLEYARSLSALGQLAYDVGDFDAAETSFREALAIQRAEASNLHADIAGSANDLAATLRALGRIEEAETLHREALALRRAAEDRSLPVAESLNNLSAVHIERGELDTAIEVLREALSIRAAILGEEHLLTLQTSSNLAITLWRAGERTEALEWMATTERGYRALGGDGESELAVALANHSTMQRVLGDLDGAASSLDEALALQRKRLGGDHPSLAETLSNLAVLHHTRRNDDEARECWLEALRIRKASSIAPQVLAETLYGFGVFQFDRG